jgi:hypothetical protein
MCGGKYHGWKIGATKFCLRVGFKMAARCPVLSQAGRPSLSLLCVRLNVIRCPGGLIFHDIPFSLLQGHPFTLNVACTLGQVSFGAVQLIN